jgi:hypothetical protein
MSKSMQAVMTVSNVVAVFPIIPSYAFFCIPCSRLISSNTQDKMIQCPDAHLFCHSCMKSYAETLLGSHDANVICMDQSGCKLPFTESELKRFLTPKLMALYERVKQRKDIEAAGLEGLEECPFCDYKVVIENENERLFRCENLDCGAVSCRECKKPVSGTSKNDLIGELLRYCFAAGSFTEEL